ncbi:MAG: hypothetical protein PHR83_12435 [Paludibacter sp.]|nr:hypothetical protein [Paludibacter sp.]
MTTKLENKSSVYEDTPPEPDPKSPIDPIETGKTPLTGKRLALRSVKKQLTDEELAQSGTQKMLLEMLEDAENEADNMKTYVSSFYEADKKAAILGEKLNADKSIEIFFGVGVGLGGAIFGLVPFFWVKDVTFGLICLVVGLSLTIGSCIGRAVKR